MGMGYDVGFGAPQRVWLGSKRVKCRAMRESPLSSWLEQAKQANLNRVVALVKEVCISSMTDDDDGGS